MIKWFKYTIWVEESIYTGRDAPLIELRVSKKDDFTDRSLIRQIRLGDLKYRSISDHIWRSIREEFEKGLEPDGREV